MATLLLHSAQEDRHRAVLLADFLNSLGTRCERAVDLTTWPARSADTQVAGLARWLASPDRGGEFGRATQRRLQRQNRDRRPPGRVKTETVDRTGIGALVLLLLAVALVAGVVRREDSAPPVA